MAKIQTKFIVPIRFEQDVVGRPPHAHTDPNPGITGTLKLLFDEGLTSAKYRLYIFNEKSEEDTPKDELISMAHLHAAPTGDIGELIVVILESNPPVYVNGLLKKGTITNSNIRSIKTREGYRFNTVSTLYNAIREGNLYVDIHGTGKYLAGMLRGQIFTAL